MPVALRFFGWSRSSAASGGTRGRYPGRLEGSAKLTLTVDDGGTSEQVGVPFLLMGPGDVAGLRPGAVRSVAPALGDQLATASYCPHVELAATDLPWRYGPEPVAAGSEALRPWIVLVVGTAAEVLLEPDGMVTLMPSVTRDYNLSNSARWAHVQQDDQPRISRLLSTRPLQTGQYHLAVVVPAFNSLGAPSWTPGQRVTIPAYYSWHFKTAPDLENFATLAKKLEPLETTDPSLAGLGLAPVRYPTMQPTSLGVPGALVPIGRVPAPLTQPVADDLAGRRELDEVDEAGRPIIGLPRYGGAWVTDPEVSGWGKTLNQDPRHRGVAGLGAWAGILIQEEIAAAAADRAGALFLAAAKIRALTLGLEVSGSLWERRLPTTPGGRLFLFGPSLQRMPTANGTVLEVISDLTPGRPLPAALFSSAARRLLRPGTAWTRRVKKDALAPDAILEVFRDCPPGPPRAPKGLPHADDFAEWLSHKHGAERRPLDEELEGVRQQGISALDLGQGRVQEALGDFEGGLERPSVLDLINQVGTRPPDRPCRRVELGPLEEAISRAVDPRREDALSRRRVLDSIEGLGDEPLAPTEFCPDFDLPAWRVLRDHARDWLLPGAGRLKQHSVVALETNLAFSDAFLVGLNTQALGELRWRNIPIRSGCTPLRRFWERVNAATNQKAQDILGLLDWPTTASDELGSLAHVPPGSPTVNLVLLFHTPLFRRYPGTLVYLYPDEAGAGGFGVKPNIEAGAAKRVFPSFQGEIDPEYTFFCFPVAPSALKSHWVVVEEVQRGYRFGIPAAGATTPADGGGFADTYFVDPTRVLVQGTALDPTS
jgi:hypothetical protein